MSDPPAGDDDAPPAVRPVLAQVGQVLGTVVAPATLVSALLFYFGYVSARAQLAYFGVDVDTLGYSTQDFVMRSPQPLLVPTLVLLLATAGLVAADTRARRWAAAAGDARVRPWVRALTVLGAVLLATALALLVAYPSLREWAPYALVTPALLGTGALLLARAAVWSPTSPTPRATVVLLALVVVASVFWATATLAQWSGTGQGKALARDLTALPAVVVDTRESLLPGDPTVEESVLPVADPTAPVEYRFRYRGLRLLAENDGRLFLVPERWSPAGSTYVLGPDDVRVRFRFVDDPP
ncbi:hypothetical protein [Cellulomonas wangsupingiae]|uniref:Uncharacterized protein n=1 Tax=Cellulomonas wangsupingiae TaxID=2968085 RepID=A0ABY5K7I3_9CELL|nr:hypothetical protein [Cellulomonas wangsupingiae]MCC2334613.1 hypothetical protein [Cellulomonas wangsupingiae]UUI66421.1 hypothetical protein NP075_06860 [Cellulomonas wangsupingiae]